MKSQTMPYQTTSYQANVSLWLNCNLKCPYCFGNPTAPPREWSAETAQRLDQLRDFLGRTGRWTLTLSGGEVTIYPGFAEICRRLDEDGHRVEFFSNGVKPLRKVFPGDSIRHVARVGFSYQLSSEKSAKLRRVFDENVAFLLANGVETDVNYVLYPDRPSRPQEVKEHFLGLGAEFRFLAFQGEHGGRQYPFAYSEELKKDFADYGDMRAAFLMEHGYHMPTFKKCRAGFETFYISLRRGRVYTCEQLQEEALADFTSPDGPARFLERVAAAPITCPAKRCSCRLTVDQEEFLARNDVWDMSRYPQYEAISLPLARAREHWEEQRDAFCREMVSKLQGKELYIWGGGVHTLNLLRKFREGGFPMEIIRGIIEGNSLKHGQSIAGVPIIAVERFAREATPRVTDILISSRAFEEEIAGIIADRFGDAYHAIRMYDGGFQTSFEAVKEFEMVQGS